VIELLLLAHSEPNSVSAQGATPLHCALGAEEHKSLLNVQLLLHFGASKNLRCSNDYPLIAWRLATPLDIAKAKNFGEVAKLLSDEPPKKRASDD